MRWRHEAVHIAADSSGSAPERSAAVSGMQVIPKIRYALFLRSRYGCAYGDSQTPDLGQNRTSSLTDLLALDRGSLRKAVAVFGGMVSMRMFRLECRERFRGERHSLLARFSPPRSVGRPSLASAANDSDRCHYLRVSGTSTIACVLRGYGMSRNCASGALGARTVAGLLVTLFLALSSAFAQEPAPPYRTIVSSRPTQLGRLRVLVYYDMEGLSGQSDWHSFLFRYRGAYLHGQDLLVADVNAVIDGLFEGGATEVHVVDSHGSGNPEPDLPLDRLDPRAKPVFRDQPFESYSGLVAPGEFEAIVAIGMHGKTGSGGFAAHTYEFGKEIVFNGHAMSEAELIAYSWGRVGVPLIFVSGDDTTKADLAALPWVEHVAVKKSLSTTSVELLPLPAAHRQLTQGAKRAVKSLPRMKAVKLIEPIDAVVRAHPPASLSVLEGVPGVRYSKGEVSFSAPDFLTAYRGTESLIRISDLEYNQVLYEIIRKRNDRREIFGEYLDALATRGIEDRGQTATPGASAAGSHARFFGEK